MKENKNKFKYEIGEIINVGYGITAEVIGIEDGKYNLEFSNGMSGLFTKSSVETGVFRNKERFMGAVKDMGLGFTLNVINVGSDGVLLCQYCKDDVVLESGNLDRRAFVSMADINLDRGDTLNYYGVKLKVKGFSFITRCIEIEVEYEPFKTTDFIPNTRDGIEIDADTVHELFGNSNDTYITKDGKIMQYMSEYDLTDENIKKILGVHSYDYKYGLYSHSWLTSDEYKKEVSILRTLADEEDLLGKEFVYDGSKVRIVAEPVDDNTKYIVRGIYGDYVTEVPKSKLYKYLDYFRRF